MNEFELIFRDKRALEVRQQNLEEAIEFYETRIERLNERAARPWVTRRIELNQERLDAAQEELDFVNDELTNYTDFEYERDEFNLEINHSTIEDHRGRERDFGTVSLTVADSLIDDTYQYGDSFKVITKAKKKGRGWSKTFNVSPAEGEAGDVLTASFGSTGLGRQMAKFDELTISFLNGDGDAFYSETFDVTNIV